MRSGPRPPSDMHRHAARVPIASRAVLDVIALALEEDLGTGDLTTAAVVPEGASARATIEQRAAGRAGRAGRGRGGLRARGPRARRSSALAADGGWRDPGPLAELSGPAALDPRRRARGAQLPRPPVGRRHAHGALRRRRWRARARASSTPARPRRACATLEKDAVRAGGGTNHRGGLYDAVLRQGEPLGAGRRGGGGHPAGAGRGARTGVTVEVECATLGRGGRGAGRRRRAASCSTTWTSTGCARAVALVRGTGGARGVGRRHARDTVRGIAETGVDWISVGALTHSAPALDVSLMLHALDRRQPKP